MKTADCMVEIGAFQNCTSLTSFAFPQSLSEVHIRYLQPIITQYFIDNKSEIWLLFLIAHSKR